VLFRSNATAATTALPGSLARPALAGVEPLAEWRRGIPASPAASTAALAALRGRLLVAAAGVARPERFFAMLRDAGLRFEPLALPDHHDYATLPWPSATADVVLTEKDAVKIDPQRAGTTRVWVAALDFTPAPAFDAALIALLPPPGNTHGNATS
jgi:tetraacyldisaccharide 4'-kinase